MVYHLLSVPYIEGDTCLIDGLDLKDVI